MALVRTNPEQAWNQFLYLIDYQEESGAIPDCLNDAFKIYSFVKPPVQGWSLNWMLKRTDYINEDRLGQIYAPLCKLTDYWMNYRDTDGDGLPEYYHGNDSGWDNSTIFKDGIPVAGPDLAAFLVIQMDTLAEVAQRLGFSEDAAQWRAKSSQLLDITLKSFWTGSRFIARHAGDQRMLQTDSLINYLPVLLNKRLPKEILAKLIADLKDKNLFLTDFGLATEQPGSKYYEADGYWRGPIWAPSTLLIVDGLAAAGEKELVHDISEKFCAMIKQSGMAENFNALTGEGLRDRAYTWTSSVFLILANEYL
jgi:glycogen debranching enzyme